MGESKSPTCIMNATYEDVNPPANTPSKNNESTPEYAYCEALKTNIPASVVDQSQETENTYTCIELEKNTDEEYAQLSLRENAIISVENPPNEPLYFQTEQECFKAEPSYVETEPEYATTEPECFKAEPTYVETEPEYAITEP
ncbi:uncharacterized protein LOC130623878 isoform X2 [Hydractinia symbiolongicarpus]|nr:uncharacterized protein LOC130623878 isoform X2 [Hydractinia symbiolongicarpus]